MKKSKSKTETGRGGARRSTNSPLMMDVVQRIALCRVAQRAQFVEGHELFDCSSLTADDSRKLRRLAQAVGEVADTIEELERERSLNNVEEQRAALTSLASHVVGWLEALAARDQQAQGCATARRLPRVTQAEIETILHGRPV